jgi:hypothetical protein
MKIEEEIVYQLLRYPKHTLDILFICEFTQSAVFGSTHLHFFAKRSNSTTDSLRMKRWFASYNNVPSYKSIIIS